MVRCDPAGGGVMRNEEYITLLAALGDIQSAVDAIGLDVERLMDHAGITSEPSDGEVELVDFPGWVNRPQRGGDRLES